MRGFLITFKILLFLDVQARQVRQVVSAFSVYVYGVQPLKTILDEFFRFDSNLKRILSDDFSRLVYNFQWFFSHGSDIKSISVRVEAENQRSLSVQVWSTIINVEIWIKMYEL